MSSDPPVTVKTEELLWFLAAVEEVSLPHDTLVDIGVAYLEKHSWIELLPEEHRAPFLAASRQAISGAADPLGEAERIEEEKLFSLFEEGSAEDRRRSARSRRTGVSDRRREGSRKGSSNGDEEGGEA